MDRKPQIVTGEALSLGIGAIAGLLMLGLLRHDFGWGWIWALLGGLIVGGAVALALRWALCRGGSLLDGHEAVPAPKPAPKATPPKISPSTAAETAAETAAVAPTKAALAADVGAPAPAKAPSGAPAPTPATSSVADDGPAGLAAARGGQADDLTKIKGVGPKLEQALHGMGIYHFDQIAAWTAPEIAWVDENLQGFRGRATRDDWVAQAKLLAAGGETEFSARADTGKVT
ncbi:hypothetical protein GCM10008024_16860 [Allgaiera indica]|uniref:Predicted 5' DNA nuclease, flap endonuclease-1-like, helix-3-turn-helix (H3TH) domain n=1 Tax=Allgaiera indica TaxID=765699 RepID=A0AAN4UR28_9RHOB|nr:hypothetical protein [Allgaiera indica]GHE01428.1 hypothetical protein GCM10008024_16860 [Allgaiera indica]SDW86602.1 Predicted 5' DNA nuclease, flap endonuclease-1-like, helix-3-turn-helix (H3TH) domain [Allgaiera indica]